MNHTQRTKRALVVLAEGFEEIEALAPIDILRRARVEVVVAAVGELIVAGSHGIKVECDVLIKDVGTDFDVMVLPGGGMGAKNLAASWLVNEKMLMMASSGAIIASICASPAVVLGPAGLLEGHKAVCYPGAESHYPSFSFSDERVVVDGNLITARAAGCALEFSLAIVESLMGREVRDTVAAAILFRV
ncbi:MAG: DJ-1/PfpI family protein [Sphaerochaetaceae bacterium]|jgi:4-methyl-5(b-hydroxyethyl)-thiazole monophosphate biosynthesis|nr:DJ-1/PfpI family protein [Sphaerochaetaceae bacterium]